MDKGRKRSPINLNQETAMKIKTNVKAGEDITFSYGAIHVEYKPQQP